MRISLKRLHLENFRSFQDLTVDLKNGLYAIKGRSGVGKTNLHLGIAFALGYSPYPNTELQSNLTKDKMLVELDLEVDGDPIKILRGRENKFISKEKTVEGAAAVAAAVQQLLKIDASLIETICFREQREKGRFLNLTDSNKKQFLSDLLGLNKLEKEIDFGSAKIKTYEAEKANLVFESLSLSRLIRTLEAPLLKDVPGYLEALDILHNSQRVVRGLQTQIDEFTAAKAVRNLEVKAAQNDIATKYDKLLTDLRNSIKNYDEEARVLESSNLIRRSVSRYRAQIEEEKAKLSTLEENKCFTCETVLNDVSKIRTEVECHVIAFESKLAEEISAIESNEAKAAVLREKVVEFKKELVTTEANRANEFKELIKAVEQKYHELSHIEIDLKEKVAAETQKQDAAKVKIRQHQVNEGVYEHEKKTYDAEVEKQAEFAEEKASLLTRIAVLDAKLESEKSLYAFNKEFLTQIFAEVLKEVESITNEIIPKIENVKTVAFSFTTQAQTQDGKDKNSIESVIMKNGVKVSAKSGLSGGQFASLEFAVDLAVAEVISRRTGLNFGWLILDEPFDGLGVEEKEACLEFLKTHVTDKTVMIIDHSSEIKEWFDKFYFIDMDNGFSILREEV